MNAVDDEYAAYRHAFYSQIGERFETFESMRRFGPAFRRDEHVSSPRRAAAERVYRNPQIYSSKFGPIGAPIVR